MPPPQQLLSSSLSFKCLNFYLKVYLILLFILISALLPLSAPSDCDKASKWPIDFCSALKNSTLLDDSALNDLKGREGKAWEMFCDMDRLLKKIDCEQPYSVNPEQSRQCQEAYQDWACSVIVESAMDENESGKNLLVASGSLMPSIPPCDSICHRVLRVCPYLTPDRNQLGPSGHPALHPSQYGGHPAFYCPIRSVLLFAAFKASRSSGESGTDHVRHRYFYQSGSKVNLTDELINNNDTSCCWTYSAALKTEQYGLFNDSDEEPTPIVYDDISSYGDGDLDDGLIGYSNKIPYHQLDESKVQIQCLQRVVEHPKDTQTSSSSSSSAHTPVTEAEHEPHRQRDQHHPQSSHEFDPPVPHSDFQTSRLLHSSAGGTGHGNGKDSTSPDSHSQPSTLALSRSMSRSLSTHDTDMVANIHLHGQSPVIPSQDSSESNYNYLHDDWFDVVSPRSKSIQKRNNYNFLKLVSSSSSNPNSNKEQKQPQSHQHEQPQPQEPSSVLNRDISVEEEDAVSLYDGPDGVDGLEEDSEDPDTDLQDGEDGMDQHGSDLEGEEGTMSTRSSEDSRHRRRQEAAIMDEDFISTVSVRIERSISSSAQERSQHQLSSAKSSGSRPELFIEKLLPFRVRVNVNLSRFRFTNILPLPSFLTNVFNVNANANKNTNTIHHNNHYNRCFPVLFNILLLLILILLLIIVVLLTTNFLPILLQILYTTAHFVSSTSPSPKSVVQFPCQTTRTRLARLARPNRAPKERQRNSKYDYEEKVHGRTVRGREENKEYDELTTAGSGGEVTQVSSSPHLKPSDPNLVSVFSKHHEESVSRAPPKRPENRVITFSKSNNNNTNNIIINMIKMINMIQRINTDSTGSKTLDKDTKHTYTSKIITNTSIIHSGQTILLSKQIKITTKTFAVSNVRSDSSEYNYWQYCYYYSHVAASELLMTLTISLSSSQLSLVDHLCTFNHFQLLLLCKSEHLIEAVTATVTVTLTLTLTVTHILVKGRKMKKVVGVDREIGQNWENCVQFPRSVQKSLVWTWSELRLQLQSALAPVETSSVLNSVFSSRPFALLKCLKLRTPVSSVLENVENLPLVRIGRRSVKVHWQPFQLIKLKFKEIEKKKLKKKKKNSRELRVSVLLVAMDRELKLNVVKQLIKFRHAVDDSNYFSNGIILNVIRRKSHPIIISRLRFFHHLLLRHHHFVWVVHRLSDVDKWNFDLLDLPLLRHRHPLLFLKCTTRIRMNLIMIVIITDDDKDNIASTFVTSIWLRYRNDNRSSGCRRTNIRIRSSSRSRRHRRCTHNSNNNNTVSKTIKLKIENSSTMIVCNINNKIKHKLMILNLNKDIEEVTCRNNNNYYYSRPLLLLSVVLLTRLTLAVSISMMIVNKRKLFVMKIRWERGKILLLLLKLLKSKVMKVMRISMLLLLSIHVFFPWENVLVLKVSILLILLLLVLPQSPLLHLPLQAQHEQSKQSRLFQKEDKLSYSHSDSQSSSYSDISDSKQITNDDNYSYWRMAMNMNQGIILTDPVRDRQQHGQSISILPKTVSDLSLKFLKYSKQKPKLLEGQSEILVLSLLVVVLHSMSNNQRSFSASNTITEVNYYYRYNLIISHKHIDTL